MEYICHGIFKVFCLFLKLQNGNATDCLLIYKIITILLIILAVMNHSFIPTDIKLKKRKENGNIAFRCNKRITIVSAGLHQNPYNITNKVNIFQHDTYISPFPISKNDKGYCIQILITSSSNAGFSIEGGTRRLIAAYFGIYSRLLCV